jgi:hypothetical protein
MTEGHMQERNALRTCLAALLALGLSWQATAQDAELAQELTNPLANLVTVPIQMNLDRGLGPDDDGDKTHDQYSAGDPLRSRQ